MNPPPLGWLVFVGSMAGTSGWETWGFVGCGATHQPSELVCVGGAFLSSRSGREPRGRVGANAPPALAAAGPGSCLRGADAAEQRVRAEATTIRSGSETQRVASHWMSCGSMQSEWVRVSIPC